MFNEKLTQERKEQVKLIMCNFIDNLAEDDQLLFGGKTHTDTFSGQGNSEMTVHAKKKIS